MSTNNSNLSSTSGISMGTTSHTLSMATHYARPNSALDMSKPFSFGSPAHQELFVSCFTMLHSLRMHIPILISLYLYPTEAGP